MLISGNGVLSLMYFDGMVLEAYSCRYFEEVEHRRLCSRDYHTIIWGFGLFIRLDRLHTVTLFLASLPLFEARLAGMILFTFSSSDSSSSG